MGWGLVRAREATPEQLVATGAVGGFGTDPIDGDRHFRPAGGGPREIPAWTREKARAWSVAGYRSNPMARAIIDTYTSFAVGDSGLTLQCSVPEVRAVAEEFWLDPANRYVTQADLMLRGFLMYGEAANEMLVSEVVGRVRRSPIDPTRVVEVSSSAGNALWPDTLWIEAGFGERRPMSIARHNDITMLREGRVLWQTGWRTDELDQRGYPFLGPILDWLQSYDDVLHNLVDRTALLRYLAFDVTIDGTQKDVDEFIAQRGLAAPRSGTVEVHNSKVSWDVKNAQVGAFEDKVTSQALLTNVAAGAGLAKTWLAEPEDANRATSLTMAEPVRRRVGGLQNLWLGHLTEHVRYAVDQAVAAGRLPATVEIPGAGGEVRTVPASECVVVNGPEIANSDAQIAALVLVNLSAAITGLRSQGVLSDEAARHLVRKGWEDYVGVPYTPELDKEDPDDIASEIDELEPELTEAMSRRLALLG